MRRNGHREEKRCGDARERGHPCVVPADCIGHSETQREAHRYYDQSPDLRDQKGERPSAVGRKFSARWNENLHEHCSREAQRQYADRKNDTGCKTSSPDPGPPLGGYEVTQSPARTRILLLDANGAFLCPSHWSDQQVFCSSLLQRCAQLPSGSEVISPASSRQPPMQLATQLQPQ